MWINSKAEVRARARSTLNSRDARALWSAYCDIDRPILLKSPAGLKLKASAPLAKMAALCAALRDIGGKHGVEAGLTARCGNGIVHAWFAADKDAAGIVGEARQAASACGGLLMVEAAPLAVRKSVEVWPRPNAYDLMRRLKTAFDPGNTLNPGKLFGGQP